MNKLQKNLSLDEFCYICGLKLIVLRTFDIRGYTYKVCKNCTGAVLTPRKKAYAKLKKAYDNSYFEWKEAAGLRRYLNKLSFFKSYKDWICEYYQTGKNRRLLDVGAGVVDFVRTMQKTGWDTYALEISPEQSKLIAKVLGRGKVIVGDFETTQKLPGNYFDILTFWHMLEHLKSPLEAIKKSNIILKKNGLIFAEFPNLDSFNLKLFKTFYNYYDLPGHLVYYNKRSLNKMFNIAGFEVVEISYPLKLNSSFSLGVYNYAKSRTKSLALASFFYYICLPFSLILAFCLSLNGSTDLMRVVAKKSNAFLKQ